MIRGACIIVILMTGCSWSPAGGDTVIDRVRVECADRGGTWTTVGCVHERI